MTHDHPPIYNEHTPPYCGECPLLLHEDTDGYGVCNAAGQTRNCGQVCIYANRYPHAWEVTRILHYTQKWRRGANIKMPPPFVTGVAIDTAIRELRKQKKLASS